jgi:peroxiredoxin
VLLFFCKSTPAEELSFANLGKNSLLPAFCVRQLDDNQFCSAQLRGRIAVITFFRFDQKLSIRQMSVLQKLHNKYRDKGVSFVGIVSGKVNRQGLKGFQQENGISFPLLIDSGREVSSLFGVFAVPSTGLFSKDGTLQYFTASNWISFNMSIEAHIRMLLREITQAEMDRMLNSPPVAGSAAGSRASARYNLARILFERNDLEKARTTLEATLADFPNHAPSHLLSGKIALREKNYKVALLHFEQALKLDPTLEEAQKGRQTCLDNL